MANFDLAIPLTLHYEGGYSNAKQDSGGQTFAGISRVNNPKWQGWAIIDAYIINHGLSNISTDLLNDIQLMTMVKAYYKANYWNVNRLSDINDQQLAFNVFDTGVNMGTGRAAKFLQQAANVTIDGNIGNKTIAAINNGNAITIYNVFNTLRKGKYDAIIADNPFQSVFRASWYSRIKPYV